MLCSTCGKVSLPAVAETVKRMQSCFMELPAVIRGGPGKKIRRTVHNDRLLS